MPPQKIITLIVFLILSTISGIMWGQFLNAEETLVPPKPSDYILAALLLFGPLVLAAYAFMLFLR